MAGKKKSGSDIVENAVEKTTEVAGAGVDAAKGALGAVGGAIGGLSKKAKKAASDAVDKVTDVAGDVSENAKEAADGVAKKAKKAASGAASKAKKIAADAGDIVEGAVDKVSDVAGDAVDAAKGAASKVTEVAGDAVDAAKDLASDVADKVGDVAGDAVGAAKDLGKNVSGAALGAGAAVLGGAAALAGGLGKGVKDVAAKTGEVAGEAVGLVGETAKGAASVVGHVAEEAVDAAKGAVGAVGHAASDAVDAVTGNKKGGFLPMLAMVGIGALVVYGITQFSGKAPQTQPAAVASASAPAWLGAIGDKLKAGFPWLSLSNNGNTIVASGEAADKNAKDAALAELAMAIDASEGKGANLVDNISVKGSTETPVGAALAKLGANPDAAACTTAFTETMNGRTINFATGKAIINADSSSLLSALTGIASACKAHKIEVAGHTDAQGIAASNKALSQARADAVKKFWTDKGVPAEGLSAIGYGSDKLLDTSGTKEADAKNRRVEFKVHD